MSLSKSLIGLSLVALLAGCSGNTYGTGVSSEKQLLDDVSSIVTIGSGDKKEQIRYDSRPKLIKPTHVAALPPPAESVKADSGYFPEDPEEKRARMLKQLEESGDLGSIDESQLPPDILALRKEAQERARKRKVTSNKDGDCFVCDYEDRKDLDKKRLAAKTAEREQYGVPKRKWLTEPPDEYRTPAETAPVGEVGEEEDANAGVPKKKKKTFLDNIFGG